MERLLALDVGDKTIGIAVSDLLGLTAQGVVTIRRTGLTRDFLELQEIIEKYEIKRIVVGLPKNMNNTIGKQGEKVLKFVEKLKKRFDVEVILQDERLTTVSAERALIGGDVSRKKRKKLIDMVAATYILQGYLDRKDRR